MGKGTWVSLINYSPSILSSPPCGTTRDLLPIRSPLLSLFGFLIFGLKERERAGGREGGRKRTQHQNRELRALQLHYYAGGLSLSLFLACNVRTNKLTRHVAVPLTSDD